MVENDDPDLSELEALDPKILESCTFEEGYLIRAAAIRKKMVISTLPMLKLFKKQKRSWQNGLPRRGTQTAVSIWKNLRINEITGYIFSTSTPRIKIPPIEQK